MNSPKSETKIEDLPGHLIRPSPIHHRALTQLSQYDFTNYDYQAPGHMQLAYRVPDNLIGRDLRQATREVMLTNLELMKEQNLKAYKFKQKQDIVIKDLNRNKDYSSQVSSVSRPASYKSRGFSFPKTTNEDFHNEEVFKHFLYNSHSQVKVNPRAV